MILVTPKQEVERKSEWFCGVNFFRSKFKVDWENGVWAKIRFLASGFFCSHAAISLRFLLFFQFFWSDFFLNGFPNPFILRSRSSFLFSQWKFFELYVRTCPAMFFCFVVWRSFFVLLVHIAKLKKSNFLNDFFLSLTAFARVTSFLTRFIYLYYMARVSISIIWHAGLFFRSYSGNLPAKFINRFWMRDNVCL